MIRIIIDDVLRAKLSNLDSYLELCDESGRVVGYFTPIQDPSLYQGLESPHTEEELDRRSRETSERSLDEILRDLESRA